MFPLVHNVRRLERDIPRNFIYFRGRVFQVRQFSVSISAVAIIHNLVLPRFLRQIIGQIASSLSGRLSSVQFIPFEFKSELSEIGTKSFMNYLLLTSICLPATDEKIISAYSFSSCHSQSYLIFESGSKLARIAAMAFSCSSLKLICLPASGEFLGRVLSRGAHRFPH
jgi:hypothetical protein